MTPRLVAFKDGKAICAGCPASIAALEEGVTTKVIDLPSKGPDWITVSVEGRTEQELRELPE